MHDRELVEATQAGDSDAFSVLVERYQSQIYRLCYRMTGNSSNAQDLAHEAFVEAFLKIRQLRNADKFASWFSTLTRNLCRMWHRQNRRESEALLLKGRDITDTSDESVYQRMSWGLMKLSASHRLMLVLFYWEGLSYEEISKFLNIPVGTVMSRLHRARHGLKQFMEKIVEEEDIPVISNKEFRQEVDAEIDILVKMFSENPEAMERLSVILNRSPTRFVKLMQEANDEKMTEDLALLLRRLGRPAFEVTLDSVLSADSTSQICAITLLKHWIARCKPGSFGMPAQGAYWLLDGLIASSADAQTKIELLIDLMKSGKEPHTMNLLTDVLLCFPDVALPILMAHFWRVSTPEELHRPPWLLYALCRTGTRFCEVLMGPLNSGDIHQQLIALAGLEKLVRHYPDSEPAAQLALRKRRIGNYAPISAEQMQPQILQATAAQVAKLIAHEREEIRNTALRILGLLGVDGYSDQIRSCLQHAKLSTRLVAIHAAAEIGDIDSAAKLVGIAKNGEHTERRAAIEALGRLQAVEAQSLLTRLLKDGHAEIREAAVIALGEIGGEEVRGVLQEIIRSREKALAKAAAKALRTQVKHYKPSETTRKRLNKIRGTGQPTFYTSLGAAIRALPTIQTYEERELTYRIAQVCSDYSTTRRYLVMNSSRSLMNRSGGVYELTEYGQAVWRVEHFIVEHYLR